ITAMVGPNGAGKTTLLRCLAGLQSPFSGSIHIAGVDIIENPGECRRLLGFLNDFFGLYDSLTVKQSLGYFGLAYGIPEYQIEAKIQEVAEELNLKDKLNEKVENLSRGMRQRLAIGQTIIHSPSLLILDEPASGLDPEARYALGQLFLELNRRGMTLLVSSHILAELNEYANYLLILKDGKVIDEESGKIGEAKQVQRTIICRYLSGETELVEFFQKEEITYTLDSSKKTLVFTFSGDDSELAIVLKNLIHRNIEIYEYSIKKENIQDKYLSILRSEVSQNAIQ
ncbi:MAG: ABC transporter ATP-binding protein, partial [Leptospiraceae bacterium]|nr:ABC transporter ATP-binding protein [Leptospiraceae bacterium]